MFRNKNSWPQGDTVRHNNSPNQFYAKNKQWAKRQQLTNKGSPIFKQKIHKWHEPELVTASAKIERSHKHWFHKIKSDGNQQTNSDSQDGDMELSDDNAAVDLQMHERKKLKNSVESANHEKYNKMGVAGSYTRYNRFGRKSFVCKSRNERRKPNTPINLLKYEDKKNASAYGAGKYVINKQPDDNNNNNAANMVIRNDESKIEKKSSSASFVNGAICTNTDTDGEADADAETDKDYEGSLRSRCSTLFELIETNAKQKRIISKNSKGNELNLKILNDALSFYAGSCNYIAPAPSALPAPPIAWLNELSMSTNNNPYVNQLPKLFHCSVGAAPPNNNNNKNIRQTSNWYNVDPHTINQAATPSTAAAPSSSNGSCSNTQTNSHAL